MSSKNETKEHVEIRQHAQRIFLYIRLKALEKLPSSNGKLEIHLCHANETLTKLEDHYPTDNIIHLSIFDIYKPTFSLMIEQDSIDDMNILCDNPLLLTLYERVRVRISHNKGEEATLREEEEGETDLYEEELRPLSQGHIDLLKLYTKKRETAAFSCILYPLPMAKMSIGSCITTWEIYALLPLLKELTIHNIVYISFESIFNARSNIADFAGTLVADFYFESKANQHEKVKFCTYNKFTQQQQVVPKNSLQLKWETLIRKELNNHDCLGIHCGNSVSLFNMFRRLVYAEGSQIDTERVNIDDEVIASNSTHRYVLSEQFVRVLEDVLAFDEQQLLIELYQADEPNEILAYGRIDTAILLYPEVNANRFAVQLFPIHDKSSKINVKSDMGPMFAIISICFLIPLTESFMLNSMDQTIAKHTRGKSTFHKLLCQRLEAYYNFERQIKNLIFFIIKNDIKKIEDAKNILCCQKENLSNKLFKLISLDFNIRTPTKDSIEFHNLMTKIYKYAVQCTYDILKTFGNNVPNYLFTQNHHRIVDYCSTAQYLMALREELLAKYFWEKAEKLAAGDTFFRFLKLISDVENLDFKKAKTYYSLPKNEQLEIAQNLTDFIRIYIKYVETLCNEVTFNEAMENLIIDLKELISSFPKDIIYWVLLHCIFKYCGYLPGIAYTRWRYEHLQTDFKDSMPKMPISRYRLTNPCELMFSNSTKQTLFLDVFDVLTTLGLYKFGEFIFKEFQRDCTLQERYLTQTTLKILANEVPNNYPAQTFPFSKVTKAIEQEREMAYLMSINGHLEYSRGTLDLAMENYGKVVHMDLATSSLCSLALLRYGFYMLNDGRYEKAREAFNKIDQNPVQIIAAFGLGKALFKMKKLDEAELEFEKCTSYKIHIPDVWAYLALINLLQKKTYKALEFWKYAKINPDIQFSVDLQQELENVNTYDVELTVDKPPMK
ncbi:uncharacterized protein [Eurosta solidaginis]|uniref:uncharacterized protein n=1 Tax=Eurosta solidaginis TaxID=178769 RepID=UPI00353155FC